MAALRNLNQENTYQATPKLERSPSDRNIEDRVLLSCKPKSSEEDDFVSVIISSDNPQKREALLSVNMRAKAEHKIPRKVRVDRTLGGGEFIAKVDKKSIKSLETAGFKVIEDVQDFVLPIFPIRAQCKSKGEKVIPSVAKEASKESNHVINDVAKLAINATTDIDNLTATGRGVSIAILDTGIAPHPDIKDKIIAFKDFVNDKEGPYDDNGHGTHVAGDAAGTGATSDGKYKGTAPDAHIVGVKVLNSDGGAKVSNIVEGIDWVIQNRDKYNIRVINMSIGVPSPGYQFDPIDKAVERATTAGIVVVAAAGNEGPKMGTIGGAPGNSPFALTVGAVDDKNTVDKSDDEIAAFSSRGPTIDGISKPDLVAPGTNIISLNISGSQIDKIARAVKYLKELPDEKLKDLPKELFEGLGLNPAVKEKTPGDIRKYLEKNLPNINYVDEYYVGMPGTSMAAPITAGIVADLLETNPQLSPAQVKDILTKTSNDMGLQKAAQGSGVIDPPEALYKASNIRGELPESFVELRDNFIASTRFDVGFLISGSAGGSKVKT
jgi:serine protease AprX